MAFFSAKIDSNASGIISLFDDLINYVLYLALCVDLLLRINSSSGSIDLFLLLFLLMCVCACVCNHGNSKTNLSSNLKFEHIVVCENSSVKIVCENSSS